MFRNILLFSFGFLLLTSCSQVDEKTMTLNGQVTGLKKGNIYLERYIDTAYVIIDSASIFGDSNFKLTQRLESPEVLHLHLRLENGNLLDDRVSFFANAGEINLKTKLEDFANAKVEGSENHELLLTYYKIAKRYSDRNLELIVEELNAKKDGADSLLLSIEDKRIKTIQASYLAAINFALQNTSKDIAPFLMVYETPGVNIKYLDTVYNSLDNIIKEGKYGKELKAKIEEEKAAAQN